MASYLYNTFLRVVTLFEATVNPEKDKGHYAPRKTVVLQTNKLEASSIRCKLTFHFLSLNFLLQQQLREYCISCSC